MPFATAIAPELVTRRSFSRALRRCGVSASCHVIASSTVATVLRTPLAGYRLARQVIAGRPIRAPRAVVAHPRLCCRHALAAVGHGVGLVACSLLALAHSAGCVGELRGGDDGDAGSRIYASDPNLEYYASVDDSNADELRRTLHDVIDDHYWYDYTHSTRTDIWDILEHAQTDPADPDRVIDVYRNASFNQWGAGNYDYNREHTWP